MILFSVRLCVCVELMGGCVFRRVVWVWDWSFACLSGVRVLYLFGCLFCVFVRVGERVFVLVQV